MTEKTIAKSALMMAIVVVSAVIGYETYLRKLGLGISYDDSPALWANARQQANDLDNSVVFIGSSRIKYDLDIATWEAQTGLKAIQLAHVGSTPMPVLEDLANDAGFKGNLVIDVTEPLFFSGAPFMLEKPVAGVNYFHDETLAQKASFELNQAIESKLVFLDKDNFSLNARLDRFMLPNRDGVFALPVFPTEFALTGSDRQAYMTPRFARDTAQVNVVRNIWGGLLQSMKAAPAPTDEQISGMIAHVKQMTDKIVARGGHVIFTRTPSSGFFLQAETMGFPRQKFWEKLLAATNCQGVHFQDHAAFNGLVCPEFSHLDQTGAKKYTIALASILEQKHFIPARKRLLSKL